MEEAQLDTRALNSIINYILYRMNYNNIIEVIRSLSLLGV